MPRCDLTGVSCESRETLMVPGNPPLWVSPSVKTLFLLGHSFLDILQMERDLKDKLLSMSDDERKKFFKGSNLKVE